MKNILFAIFFLLACPILRAQTTLVDSYSESNRSSFYTLSTTTGQIAGGQSFTGNGQSLTSCKFFLSKEPGTTGKCVAKLFAHAGTFGVSGLPTGTTLATSDSIDVTTIPDNPTRVLITFAFQTPYVLTNGTNYFITAHFAGDYVYMGSDVTASSHGGNASYYNSNWAYEATTDICFYVYSTVSATRATKKYFPVVRTLLLQ